MGELNALVWYTNRELDIVPPHFKRSTTIMTPENLFWVRSKLTGRYSINENFMSDSTNAFTVSGSTLFDLNSYIYFEDERELVLFELRWAGGK